MLRKTKTSNSNNTEAVLEPAPTVVLVGFSTTFVKGSGLVS